MRVRGALWGGGRGQGETPAGSYVTGRFLPAFSESLTILPRPASQPQNVIDPFAGTHAPNHNTTFHDDTYSGFDYLISDDGLQSYSITRTG